jgi:hypothetical protein
MRLIDLWRPLLVTGSRFSEPYWPTVSQSLGINLAYWTCGIDSNPCYQSGVSALVMQLIDVPVYATGRAVGISEPSWPIKSHGPGNVITIANVQYYTIVPVEKIASVADPDPDWIRIRIGSEFNGVPQDPGSGSRKTKITYKSRKK